MYGAGTVLPASAAVVNRTGEFIVWWGSQAEK